MKCFRRCPPCVVRAARRQCCAHVSSPVRPTRDMPSQQGEPPQCSPHERPLCVGSAAGAGLGVAAYQGLQCSLHPGQLRARTGSPKCIGHTLRSCDGTTLQRVGRERPAQSDQGVGLLCPTPCAVSGSAPLPRGLPHPTSVGVEDGRRLGQGVVWDKRVPQTIGQYGRPRGVIMQLPLGPTSLSATDPAGVTSGA